MNNSQSVQITKDQTGKEIVMVRADKTLKEMMEEKPSSRWSANYWHPKYDELINIIRRHKTFFLDEYRSELKSGYRSGGVKFSTEGIPYLQVRNILDTGVDLINADLIPSDSPARQTNKKIVFGDLLLNRSGEGSVGRLTVFLSQQEAYVGGHVYRFSVKNMSAIYLTVFLKTIFGKGQIHRFESGVSGKTEIDLEEILHIEIPFLQDEVEDIESEYKKMSNYHEKAMEAKKKGNEVGYKNNLDTAEKLLKELISKTEAVIRGERENIL